MNRSFRPSPLSASLLVLVMAAGCKRTVPLTDASLTAAVQSRLSSDAAIAAEPIQSSAQAGIVTLSGPVSSEAARSLAANDAAQVPGVKTVINNLSVQTAASVAPPVVETPQPATPEPAPVTPRKRVEASRPAKETRRPAPIVRDQSTATYTPPTTPAVSQPAAPPPPAAPTFRNITVPAGSILPIRITQTLDSATTQQGATFSGTISSDVTSEGTTVLRQGTPVSGRVTAVQEAAHFKGNSLLTIEVVNIDRRGQPIAVTTEPYSTEGKGRGKNTALKTGGGAAVGAILGGILGGGKGAAIGAAAGGGTGAGVNAITRGEQVQIPAESLIRFRLASPITVRVSSAAAADDQPAGTNDSSSPELQRRPSN